MRPECRGNPLSCPVWVGCKDFSGLQLCFEVRYTWPGEILQGGGNYPGDPHVPQGFRDLNAPVVMLPDGTSARAQGFVKT